MDNDIVLSGTTTPFATVYLAIMVGDVSAVTWRGGIGQVEGSDRALTSLYTGTPAVDENVISVTMASDGTYTATVRVSSSGTYRFRAMLASNLVYYQEALVTVNNLQASIGTDKVVYTSGI